MDTFSLFLNKWVTPFTIISVLGGVVWGVQLNIAVLEHTRLISFHQAEMVLVQKSINQDKVDMARTALILDQISRRLAETQSNIAKHNREAEEWKRKILLNESAIKSR